MDCEAESNFDETIDIAIPSHSRVANKRTANALQWAKKDLLTSANIEKGRAFILYLS